MSYRPPVYDRPEQMTQGLFGFAQHDVVDRWVPQAIFRHEGGVGTEQYALDARCQLLGLREDRDVALERLGGAHYGDRVELGEAVPQQSGIAVRFDCGVQELQVDAVLAGMGAGHQFGQRRHLHASDPPAVAPAAVKEVPDHALVAVALQGGLEKQDFPAVQAVRLLGVVGHAAGSPWRT